MFEKRDLKKELNAEQYRVVTEGDGPCLVLAGAGSGKTRTIVYRVAHLLSQGVPAEHILLLTFTNKAADEMMARISDLCGYGGVRPRVMGGTFHSIANRILRVHSELLGFDKRFTILDQDDAKSLMKASIKESGHADKIKKFPSPAVIHAVSSYARNAMRPIRDVIERRHPGLSQHEDAIMDIIERYDAKKRMANAMDFDDLLLSFHDLLHDEPVVREQLSKRFRYVLVDEYQDTNALQSRIVRLLVGENGNVLAVGDDAQSIYSFRAADVRHILDFPDHYPGARTFRLETNYRSTPEILDLANDVIARNVEQFPKALKSVKSNGVTPAVIPKASAAEEARFVADRVDELLEAGTPASEIAVLFRATHHSQQLEFELMRRGVAYDYRGGLRFFDRAHVRDVLAFLRLRQNVADEAAWRRVLAFQRGIGQVTAGKIVAAVRTFGALENVIEAPVRLGAKAALGWKDVRETLSEMVRAEEETGPEALIQAVLASPYVDHLEAEYPNASERIDDIERLSLFAEQFETLDEFLAEVTLNDALGRADRDSAGRGKIVLSTIHQAKGLEWDTVFILHLANTAFPNRKAAMEEGGLEEERRLFYVAVTRAKRLLYLCYPQRFGFDAYSVEQPSLFLAERDPSVIDASAMEDVAFAEDSPSVVFYDDNGDADDSDGGDSVLADVRHRMKKVNSDWKKKSFLREVE